MTRERRENFISFSSSDKYRLLDFTFENCDVQDEARAFDKSMIENTVIKNIIINGETIK